MERSTDITFEAGDQEQGDLLLLAALQRDGFDLSCSAEIAAFLDMPDLDDARAAALELRRDGWAVDVHVAKDGHTWTICAERCMVPSWPNVCEMGERMNDLAGRYGGAYDGWGVSGG